MRTWSFVAPQHERAGDLALRVERLLQLRPAPPGRGRPGPCRPSRLGEERVEVLRSTATVSSFAPDIFSTWSTSSAAASFSAASGVAAAGRRRRPPCRRGRAGRPAAAADDRARRQRRQQDAHGIAADRAHRLRIGVGGVTGEARRPTASKPPGYPTAAAASRHSPPTARTTRHVSSPPRHALYLWSSLALRTAPARRRRTRKVAGAPASSSAGEGAATAPAPPREDARRLPRPHHRRHVPGPTGDGDRRPRGRPRRRLPRPASSPTRFEPERRDAARGLPPALARRRRAGSSARPSWPSSTPSGTCSTGSATASSSPARPGRSSRRAATCRVAVDVARAARRTTPGASGTASAPWDYAAEPYADWCAKNRAVGGIELQHRPRLRRHPRAATRRRSPSTPSTSAWSAASASRRKFCISNPGLRKLVADDALRAVRARTRPRQSVSVDPSDGGGWCECAECKKLGSVSDRALTLANEVAAAVDAKHPGKLVGMYAYNEHSPPPSDQGAPERRHQRRHGVHHAAASPSTSCSTAGRSKATTLGIREYYSVNTWDRDLPGAARGGRPRLPARRRSRTSTPRAPASCPPSRATTGGRTAWATTSPPACCGTCSEAEQVDALRRRLPRQVRSARRRSRWREFYELLDGAKRAAAVRRPGRPDVPPARRGPQADRRRRRPRPARRPDALRPLRRAVARLLAARRATARQAAFEALIRHAYRMRDDDDGPHARRCTATWPAATSRVTHARRRRRGTCRRGRTRGRAARRSPRERARRRSSPTGIANRKLLDFTPVAFSDDLVPAAPLKLPDGEARQRWASTAAARGPTSPGSRRRRRRSR